MITLQKFASEDFLGAIKDLFAQLSVPVNYVSDRRFKIEDVLRTTQKETVSFQLINDIYTVGIVDDAAFEGNTSLEINKIQSDYDGILIFGVTLESRKNGQLPTRTQLAEITRAFNREFFYTPVVVVFKYEHYLALANSERLKYKQEWREGEKAGKVSLLRDVDFNKPHAGHLRIIFGDGKEKGLQIDRKKIDSFDTLYKYWQEIFSVSLLNKKFYQELSNWYFWAIKHVTFPGEPKLADAHLKKANLDDLLQEHKATNVIRLLTRILFVWFIKEKKLIPDDLFDLKALQDDILNDISPYHEIGMFKDLNKESVYYKAILQNLFFATLNCPIQGDKLDNRKRSFRGDGYGTHRGIDYLMRYKSYFKNPDGFLEKLNSVVPFLNGGLFECLDDKENNTYIDGFSDQMTKGEQLIVPDYLFFGVEEEADLSDIVGISDKKYKQAAVKGLINILKSYKFTITENTPIEEEVALDPELLGKVFENLLASYNPETKTTARKQTGSFYTPREIVNYMVDESLIAYLKNKILSEQSTYIEIGKVQTNLFGNEGKQGQQTIQMDVTGSEFKGNEAELDVLLHELMSYNPGNPFKTYPNTTKLILEHLNKCTILDPACGSGAFPMGILQKMVHVLQKLDPDNTIWKQIQIEKAKKESDAVFEISDKQAREERLLEINEAFDQSINDPDYARKLFLIENCIYGVDIQPIATQISKLRFFISLVVEQKVIPEKENFGIRPLPNLETKFVAANTLIGIAKDEGLFETDEVKNLKKELKVVRHKIFSLKSKKQKISWREKDKELREKLSSVLKNQGLPLDTAEKLTQWDPYDQNASSAYFDPEWMFGNEDGFDVVIGNPPYIKEYTDKSVFNGIRGGKYYQGKMDLWYAFACTSIDHLCQNGLLCFIATNNWVTNAGASILRDKIIEETKIEQLHDFGSFMIFESAAIQTMILLARKGSFENYIIDHRKIQSSSATLNDVEALLLKNVKESNSIRKFEFEKRKWKNKTLNFENDETEFILNSILASSNFRLDSKLEVAQGIVPPQDFLNRLNQEKLGRNYSIGEGIFNLNNFEYENLGLNEKEKGLVKPFYTTNELNRFWGSKINSLWVIYTDSKFKDEKFIAPYPNLKRHLDKYANIITSDNWPYGLHRARNEYFFKGEKIISLRKCAKPTFTFTEFDCYVSQTFFVIKSNRINQKYLTAILNSKVIEYWLRFKGKMQGDLFQVDKAPILEIPIYKSENQSIISTIVDFVIYQGKKGFEVTFFENIINSLVFNLYFPYHMKERGIDVFEYVERDMNEVMQGREFEELIDVEKEQVIEALHTIWSHPDNEVRNRIKLFAVRSPEILKPILES